MLISVQSYRIELRVPSSGPPAAALPKSKDESAASAKFSEKEAGSFLPKRYLGASDIHLLKNLDVVLVIDELRVISFDRYGMKLPSSVAFDDQVRSNLSFLRHFLMKQALIL